MPGDLGLESLDVALRAVLLHATRIIAAVQALPIAPTGPAARLGRFGLGLVLGLAAMSARGSDAFADPGGGALRLAILVVREILFGLLLGWVAGLAFDAVRTGGALIATEMGLNMANQVDPVTRASQPLLSHLFQAIALVLFFGAGGHGMVLGAVLRSFESVPPGRFVPGPATADAVLSFTGTMMAAGLRFAGPTFLLLVVLTVCIGFLAKVAPALNILEASYPVRILGALALLATFLPWMMDVFDGLLETAGLAMNAVVEGSG